VPPVRTPALILHAFPYGDTSRILRLFTLDFGLRSVIAKGAHTPRSRFGGVLEPFTEGEAHFILREGRDLLTLSSFSLIRSRQAIGRDFLAFAGASLIAEVLLRFATEDPQPEAYRAVIDAFDRLCANDFDPGANSMAALWKLIALFGYQPDLESCLRCRRSILDNQFWHLDAQAGGAVCLRCHPAGRSLDPPLRLEILRMTTSAVPQSHLHDRKVHADLLHAFLSAHLFHGRPLRSLPLFLDQFR
jgi:DNA repair protein RecO (recombination protein O)